MIIIPILALKAESCISQMSILRYKFYSSNCIVLDTKTVQGETGVNYKLDSMPDEFKTKPL